MGLAIEHIKVPGILTKSNLPVADYSVNPYVGCPHACRYCYASFMKRFTNHPEPWGSFLDVKEWPKITDPQKYDGKELFIGSVTDPYNPLEEKYGRTRELLEEFKGSGVKISIATKSDLAVRDLELIRTFKDARISWSINTLDEGFRQDMDRAVSIDRRFAAMKKFYDAGIRTTCFISPIFPGITDAEKIIERARDRCSLVWLENLNLRGSYRTVILDYIRDRHPELSPLYDEIYRQGKRDYWERLDRELRDYAARQGLDYVRADDSRSRPFGAPPVIVNYFYHEEVKRSAKRKAAESRGAIR